MSHKFKSAGLRYELATSLEENIVWCSGPYPAGSKKDLQIYRDTLQQYLEPRELIIGDSAYLDPTCIYDVVSKKDLPSQSETDRKLYFRE